ncbi:hypothetical protein [Aquabacter sediminis]|nr:hypothetical protein [Aquabacter sp. P-9]
MEVLLAELLAQVDRIEVDPPELASNNVLQGFQLLPCRLFRAPCA